MNAQANHPPVPFRKIKTEPITFRESTDHTEYVIQIPEIVQAKAALKRMHWEIKRRPWRQWICGATLCITQTMSSSSITNSDVGQSWDLSGHHSNLKFLDISRAMYAECRILGQHGDNSGKWTPEQLEIIRRQHLEHK